MMNTTGAEIRRGRLAAVLVAAVALAVFLAVSIFGAEGRRQRGPSSDFSDGVTIGKVRLPGKHVERLPFDSGFFKDYAFGVEVSVPRGRAGRGVSVAFYDKDGANIANVAVSLLDTWRQAQRVVALQAAESRIVYSITPTDYKLEIGDAVFFAWDKEIEDATKVDESEMTAASFTRNNVAVMGVLAEGARSRALRQAHPRDRQGARRRARHRRHQFVVRAPRSPDPRTVQAYASVRLLLGAA